MRRGHFFRSATVQVSTGQPAVAGWIAWHYLAIVLIVACGVLAGGVAVAAMSGFSGIEMWISGVAIVLAGLAAGWTVARMVDAALAKRILSRHRRWVLSGETLVIASASREDAATVAGIFAEAAGEHPAVFVLHPDEPPFQAPATRSQPALGDDEIHIRAAKLAQDIRNVSHGRPPQRSLLPRLD
ncbi:MAG TPA: hypothetical protein VG820_09900, partial [Fimbriimonadaceae bacterium]|nr:hypothetical protein [Fimbriimonadaceae bacterium]